MKSQTALQTLTASPAGLRLLLLATLLIAGTALSTGALAASGLSDCDRLASDLRSLEVPAVELPLDAGEHSAEDASFVAPDPRKARTEAGTAPVLLLTPRVADIVREVFDTVPVIAIDDGTDDDVVLPEADPGAAGGAPATDVPPVVRAPSLPRIAPPGTRDAAGGGAHYVPRFQSPMYRTDI